MSQAVIDFCEGLKTTLLAIEDRLAQAKNSLETGAAEARGEARKHLDEATEQLAKFRAHAGVMAEAIKADLPHQTETAKEKLKTFGQEAQVAMRHAVVFLAENTAQALEAGAKSAQRVAENLRHETAVIAPEPEKPAS